MKTKELEYEGFPQVWKGKGYRDGKPTVFVTLIYQNRSETYVLDSRFSGEKDCEYDPYNEVEIVKGNGARRVHGMKTVKVVDFTK